MGRSRSGATARRWRAPRRRRRSRRLDPVEVPDWLTAPVAPEPEPLPPIRPSSALGAADRITRPGDGPYAPEARLRGTLVHALLERLPALPPERRDAHGAGLCGGPRAAPAPRTSRESDRRQCAGRPDHAGPQAPVRPRLAGRSAHRRAGRDGRRASSWSRARSTAWRCSTARCWWPTSRPRPARPGPDEPPPLSYVAQLALYRALLREIYPDKRVRAFLVWTSGPVIRELMEPELDSALTLIKAA